MKNLKKLSKLCLLLFTFSCLFAMNKTEVEAAKKSTSVVYDQTSNSLLVKLDGKVLYTSPYAYQVVYAKTDITFVRKGPGAAYKKVKKIKKNLGEKVIRVGSICNNKWSIIMHKNKYYFVKTKYLTKKKPAKYLSVKLYTPGQLRRKGVIYWNGWRFTWYSQRRMPGHGLHIPGRHVDKNGYVCDKNGYICLASGKLSKGSVVRTPFGKKGKVYDSGCARNTLDVYTNF